MVNRYVGDFSPMPGVSPDYPAKIARNTRVGIERTLIAAVCRHLRSGR